MTGHLGEYLPCRVVRACVSLDSEVPRPSLPGGFPPHRGSAIRTVSTRGGPGPWQDLHVTTDVNPSEGHHREAFERTGYELAFDESFSDPALDCDRWVAHNLPHWTTPERSALRAAAGCPAAAHRGTPAGLAVRGRLVGGVQHPDGDVLRAARIPVGQHRHGADLAVTSEQSPRRLFTPSTGLVEAVLRASPDPTCMLAFWLVGFEEESAEQSGEICVAELFGSAIGPRASDDQG
jgi:hypothetical protein